MSMMPPFFGVPGQPVPAVDPEDLKIVYEFLEETAHNNPKGGVGVSVEIFKKLCKPGADISAVSYRAGMLGLLMKTAVSKDGDAPWKDLLATWTKDGHLDAGVYREFAQLPMEWMGVGVVTKGFPFDVELLVRRLGKDGLL